MTEYDSGLLSNLSDRLKHLETLVGEIRSLAGGAVRHPVSRWNDARPDHSRPEIFHRPV
jgi:hypothetical protein